MAKFGLFENGANKKASEIFEGDFMTLAPNQTNVVAVWHKTGPSEQRLVAVIQLPLGHHVKQVE